MKVRHALISFVCLFSTTLLPGDVRHVHGAVRHSAIHLRAAADRDVQLRPVHRGRRCRVPAMELRRAVLPRCGGRHRGRVYRWGCCHLHLRQIGHSVPVHPSDHPCARA